MRKLAVLALIAGCYRSPAPTAPAPAAKPETAVRHARTAADPLGFLPGDAELVAHLDLDQLRKTPLWARFEPAVLARVGPVLEQFKLACGFDPLPQIEQLALGVRQLGSPQLEGVLVIRGIVRAQLMGCMERVVASKDKVATIIYPARSGSPAPIDRGVVLLHADPGERPVAFGFADSRTLVILAGERAGTARGLHEVLDAGTPLRGSEAFMELFGRLEPKRVAWFFVDGRAQLFQAGILFNLRPHAVFGSLDVATGATAKVYARMPSAAEATSFATTMQGQLGPAQALVEKLEITADASDVVVDLGLTEDQVMLAAGLLAP